MKKVIRLTESDLTELVKKVINESNIITEQLAVLNYPLASILFMPGDNTKQIRLKALDPKTKTYSVLNYNVTAKYSVFDFDVQMRNFKRSPAGYLKLEALPSNTVVQKALKALVPKESVTKDGWLMVSIAPEKINDAIQELKKNKGSKATIDAGQGVKIILSYAK